MRREMTDPLEVARARNGMLEITLPKRTGPVSRTIQISVP
jgi:hypothetical protein